MKPIIMHTTTRYAWLDLDDPGWFFQPIVGGKPTQAAVHASARSAGRSVSVRKSMAGGCVGWLVERKDSDNNAHPHS